MASYQVPKPTPIPDLSESQIRMMMFAEWIGTNGFGRSSDGFWTLDTLAIGKFTDKELLELFIESPMVPLTMKIKARRDTGQIS